MEEETGAGQLGNCLQEGMEGMHETKILELDIKPGRGRTGNEDALFEWGDLG